MQATEMLKDMTRFRNLPDHLLARLEASSEWRRYEEGDTLFRTGETPRAVLAVASGQLKLFRINSAGKEQVFGYIAPGEVFGFIALTDPMYTWAFDCTARAPSEVFQIDMGVLREMLRSEPQLALSLLTEQNQRLSRMIEIVDRLSLKDAHNRLALWLDEWISANHPDVGDGELFVVLPYTQSEIAAQIGTVREVVSRGFSRMEKEGILKASGKRVTVISRARLRDMANCQG